MTYAQAPSVAPPGAAAPQQDLDLHRQLRQALVQLEAAQQCCRQLEAQLRDSQQRERRHKHRAEHDGLTGLLNRAAFHERLQRALAGAAPVAVVMVDLDGFKLVNDHHGHAAGDEVLRIIAARMDHALRNGDVVSRMGGDEFACLLQNAGSATNLRALMGKLSASIASPIQVAGHLVSLEASLGLAISPDDGHCVDTLITGADAAMYRAKRHRKAQATVAAPAPLNGAYPHPTDEGPT